jgi:molybdate transport system regulatory protein
MIEVNLDISIKKNGFQLLNPLKIMLLKEINKSGSLRIAARQLSISYQHMWISIEEINRYADHPVVVKQRGGSGGGGAVLSDYGKRLINEFTLIENEVEKFVKRMNTEINL